MQTLKVRKHAATVLLCWAMIQSSMAGEQVWRRINELPTPEAAARLQADVFVVSGDPKRLKPIETAAAGSWKHGLDELRGQLAEFGKVQQVGHFDENVVLGTKATFKSGARVLVQYPSKASRDIHLKYEDLGCYLQLEGSWQNTCGTWVADLDVNAEAASLGTQRLAGTRPADGDAALPVLTRPNFSDEVQIESGKPAMIVGKVTHGTVIRRDGEKPPSDTASIVMARLVLTRLESTGTTPSDGTSEVQNPDASEPLEFEFELFTLEGIAKELAQFDPSDLDVPVNATAQQVLAALGKWGRAGLLSKPKVVILSGQSAKVTMAERLPVVRKSDEQSDEAAPNLEYKDLGVTLNLNGKWVPGDAGRLAYAVCGLETARLGSSVSGKPPQVTKLERLYEAQLRAGSFTWLPHQMMPSSEGQNVGYWLVRVRLKEAGGVSQAEPREFAEAAPSEVQDSPTVQVDTWRLEANPAKFVENDLNVLLQGDLTDSQILERLGQLGKAERLAGATDVVDSKEGMVVKSGEVLDPTEWRGKDAAAGANTYCTRVDVRGRWLPKLPGCAELLVGIRDQDLIPPDDDTKNGGLWGISESRHATSFRLTVGQSGWASTCWASRAADPAQDKSVFMLIRVRLLPEKGEKVLVERKEKRGLGQSVASSTYLAMDNAAHVRMNVFSLDCPLDVIWQTDFHQLAAANSNAESLLAGLRHLGTAELVRTGDFRLAVVGAESSASMAESVPVVMGMGVNCRGETVKPKRDYHPFGIRSELKGEWNEGRPDLLLLDCDLKQDGKEQIDVSKELTLPVLTQLKHTQRLALAEGKPVLLVSKGSDCAVDPGRVKLDVVQVLAIDDSPKSASSRSDRGSLEAKDAKQAAHLRVETFVTDLSGNQLGSLDRLNSGEAKPGSMLMQQLTKLGPTRLSAFSDSQLVLTAKNRVAWGERAPLVSTAGRVPTINYEDGGYNLELSGRWREDTPEIADLEWRWEQSEVLNQDSPPGSETVPAAFTHYQTERHSAVHGDRPLIVQGMIVTDAAQDGPVKVKLVTTRLTVMHLDE